MALGSSTASTKSGWDLPYILWKWILRENLFPIILSQTSSALGKALENQFSYLS